MAQSGPETAPWASALAPLAWVTGAAGFIGQHLCLQLLQQGWHVLALDNLSASHAPEGFRRLQHWARQTSRLQVQHCNLHEISALRALPAPQVIFHLAARPGVRDSEDLALYQQANVLTTESLLAACASLPAVRLVFASSSSVYGEPLQSGPVSESRPCQPRSVYGQSKWQCENRVEHWSQSSGHEGVCLRLFSVYGAAQRPDMAFRRWAEALHRQEPLLLHEPARMARDFTEVRDAVAGLCLAARAPLDKAFACFNIGSGVQTPLQVAVQGLIQALQAQGDALGTPSWRVQAAHRAEVYHTWADLQQAGLHLGYKPRYTLSTGLQDFARAMSSYWKQGEFFHGVSPES